MNLNKKIIALGNALNCDVSNGIYKGKSNRYIYFSYEDERGIFFSDNEEEVTEATIRINYVVPEKYNYFSDKNKIKKLLKADGFVVEEIKEIIEKDIQDVEYVRRLIFTVSIFENCTEE